MSDHYADSPSVKEAQAAGAPEAGVETKAVEEAMRVIQKHIDREARNRWVDYLEVRDLCPRQKADLVADLAKLF